MTLVSSSYVIAVSRRSGVKLYDPRSGRWIWIQWRQVIATLSFIQVVDLAMRFYNKMKRCLAQNFPEKVRVWLKSAFDAYKCYASPGSGCSDCGALNPACTKATFKFCIFCGYSAAGEQLDALEWIDLRLRDQLLRSKCE